MCEVKTIGSLVDLRRVCKETGKPICTDNRFGSFCEDMCGLKEIKNGNIDGIRQSSD